MGHNILLEKAVLCCRGNPLPGYGEGKSKRLETAKLSAETMSRKGVAVSVRRYLLFGSRRCCAPEYRTNHHGCMGIIYGIFGLDQFTRQQKTGREGRFMAADPD
jgi:hypothetical protein